MWRVHGFSFDQHCDQIRLRDLAARHTRGSPENLVALIEEGAGNAGCSMHPQME
jgi:hypothetical protein